MHIFGKSSSGPTATLGRLAHECTLHPEESLRAVGLNLLCDHRVGEDRAEHFYEVTGRPSTVDELKRALVRYHTEWVCAQPDESYLSTLRNGHNFILNSRLPKDLMLTNVLNVSSWVSRVKNIAPLMGVRLEQGIKRLADPSIGIDETELFLDDLFKAIERYRDERPIWVARWQEFEKAIETGRTLTWNNAVGVWRRPGSWQVVLRYPLHAVDQLIRPTQLDSGFNQFHFPSPPFSDSTRGGFSMGLSQAIQASPLVPEFLHPPIRFNVAHWRAAGGLCAEVRDGPDASLWLYRDRHREKLATNFSKEVFGWLPKF
jgi:hypothetical protein